MNLRRLRIPGLLLLTAAAVAMMAWANARTGKRDADADPGQDGPAPKRARVAVMQVERQTVEILATYSGMVRPWERYTMGFEVAGRVESLGTNDAGAPLDDGDRVEAQQVLARLDDRIFRARKSETAARLELATSNMNRARKLDQAHIGAITESDLQDRLTELALAKAQHAIAEKQLEDATLRSPVRATISRRFINAGESVNSQQSAFELIENDRLLLVLGVPESDIPQLESRMRAVRPSGDPPANLPAAPSFKAYVQLLGRDVFGRPRQPFQASVYRISETADTTTGLFEVEVVLSNEDGLLKPGMVARAELVVDTVIGYRVPASSVVFRRRRGRSGESGQSGTEAFVFAVDAESADVVDATADDLSKRVVHRVRRVDLVRWVEQGDSVVVTEVARPLSILVRRGQHRLIGGEAVEVVPFADPDPDDGDGPTGERVPAMQAQR